MSGCQYCGKEINLKDGERVCPYCERAPLICWACHSYVYGDQKLCLDCGFLICKCGYCGPDCKCHAYLNDIKKLSDNRQIMEYFLKLKYGLIHRNCIRHVPISYAHGKILNIVRKAEDCDSSRSKEDQKEFMEKIIQIRDYPIGHTWTINQEREDGTYGQELRDASNYAVCRGWAQIIHEYNPKKKKGFTKFLRYDGLKCKYFDDANPTPKKCKKCEPGILHSFRLTICPNHPDQKLVAKKSEVHICQLPLHLFKVRKEEDKKDGVQEL